MLGIEIARVDGIPLIVQNLQFRHQARTSVEEQRPAALMFSDDFSSEPFEPTLKPHQNRIHQGVWRHPSKMKLSRRILGLGIHLLIFA